VLEVEQLLVYETFLDKGKGSIVLKKRKEF